MRYMIRWDNQGKFLMDGDLREAGCANPLFRTPAQRQGMGDQGEVKSAMLQPASFSLVELLDRRALSDEQVRYSDVYVLDGITDRGRRLRLVFQDKGDRLARVFTGWELKRRRKR